jgi:hypothetical protein
MEAGTHGAEDSEADTVLDYAAGDLDEDFGVLAGPVVGWSLYLGVVEAVV